MFAEHPGIEARSAGLDAAAAQPLTVDLVALGSRPVIVLGIPDEYSFMQAELVALLKERVPPLLD